MIVSFAFLTLLGYLFNITFLNEAQSSYSYRAITFSQAALGFFSSFIIYSAPKIKKEDDAITFFDYLFGILIISTLIFFPLIGTILGSTYIGYSAGLIILNGSSELQFINYIILSSTSTMQLFLGKFFPEMILIRLGLLICVIRVLLNLKTLPVRLKLFEKIYETMTIKKFTISFFQSSISVLTTFIPYFVLGSGKISQAYSISFRSSFIVENILNSKIQFQGSIKNSLDKISNKVNLVIFFIFTISLFTSQFILFILNPDIYNDNSSSNYTYFFLTLLSLIISSFLRFLISRKIFAYNYLRYNGLLKKDLNKDIFLNIVLINIFLICGRFIIPPILLIPLFFFWALLISKKII